MGVGLNCRIISDPLLKIRKMKKFICESVIILKLPVLALSILVYPKSVLSQNTILYSSPNPISQEQTSKDSSTDPKTNNVKEEWHKNGQLKSRVKLKSTV